MHLGGSGNTEMMAKKARAVLDKVKELRGGDPSKALVENGIEVVAVHNHMVHENPRIFFLHYWGIGNAEKLAKGLRAALDHTGKKAGSEKDMKINRH